MGLVTEAGIGTGSNRQKITKLWSSLSTHYSIMNIGNSIGHRSATWILWQKFCRLSTQTGQCPKNGIPLSGGPWVRLHTISVTWLESTLLPVWNSVKSFALVTSQISSRFLGKTPSEMPGWKREESDLTEGRKQALRNNRNKTGTGIEILFALPTYLRRNHAIRPRMSSMIFIHRLIWNITIFMFPILFSMIRRAQFASKKSSP